MAFPAQMRRLDKLAMEVYGIPGALLMEAAGKAVAEQALQMVPPGSRVAVLAGGGNNGGDGLVAARYLAGSGPRCQVEVFLFCLPEHLPADAHRNYQILQHVAEARAQRAPRLQGQAGGLEGAGGSVRITLVPDAAGTAAAGVGAGGAGAPDGDWLERVARAAEGADLVIDAVFGTGFHGELPAFYAALFDRINGARRSAGAPKVLAVDIPSGIDGATGQGRRALWADCTVTFGCAKVGLLIHPGAEAAGHVAVADIGLPESGGTGSPSAGAGLQLGGAGSAPGGVPNPEAGGASQEAGGSNPQAGGADGWAEWVDAELVRPWIQQRPPAAHKGTFGHLLVVGGSPRLAGAVATASWAAVQAGTGLVTAALPAGLESAVWSRGPEVMAWGLPESSYSAGSPESPDSGRHAGTLGPAAWEQIAPEVQQGRFQALAVGPGLGTAAETASFLALLLEQAASRPEIRAVLDADALNLLARDPRRFQPLLAAWGWQRLILTPHPGEAARLLGSTVAAIEADRPAAALSLAQRWQAVVVLKGARTLIASPAGDLFINSTGNPGMASGGMGDALTGMVGAFLAQRVPAVQAAVLAVFLHGLAGDLAAGLEPASGPVTGPGPAGTQPRFAGGFPQFPQFQQRRRAPRPVSATRLLAFLPAALEQVLSSGNSSPHRA